MTWIRSLLPAAGFILFIAVMAVIINLTVEVPIIREIQRLAEYEAVHIVAHIILFALLALIMGRRIHPAWIFVGAVLGTLLIESAQIFSTIAITPEAFEDSAFDLFINLIGVSFGLVILQVTTPRDLLDD